MPKQLRRRPGSHGRRTATTCRILLFVAASLLSLPAHPEAAENPGERASPAADGPVWSFTQFDEPQSAEQPARLVIGSARTKRPLIEARCYLNEKAAIIPVTLYAVLTKKGSTETIPVTFSRKNFNRTFQGTISAGDKAGNGPRNVAIKLAINLKSDFWNAMMAMKGLDYSVDGSRPQQIFFVRGSEQRISGFLQNCRSRSVGLNPTALNETIISRIYRCEDGNELRVDINVTGVAPKLKFSYKSATDVSLKATVAGSGIVYSNQTYRLKMTGTEATIESDGNLTSCKGKAGN